MNTSTPETGRISLVLNAATIRGIRLLATLTGSSQGAVAEEFLAKGGLNTAVDAAFMAAMPVGAAKSPAEVPSPLELTIAAPAGTSPRSSASASATQAASKAASAPKTPPAVTAGYPDYLAVPPPKPVEGEDDIPW